MARTATVPSTGTAAPTARLAIPATTPSGEEYSEQESLPPVPPASRSAPFRLPVSHVAYDVRLDGTRFASGETASDISIPANGDGQFAISVDLDLLSTAPQLLSTIRAGVRGEIPYELRGELGIDIPMTPPVRYRTTGNIRLLSEHY